MQIPRPHPRPRGSETLGAELRNLHFNRCWSLLLLLLSILRFKKCCTRKDQENRVQIQAPLVRKPRQATALF